MKSTPSSCSGVWVCKADDAYPNDFCKEVKGDIPSVFLKKDIFIHQSHLNDFMFTEQYNEYLHIPPSSL